MSTKVTLLLHGALATKAQFDPLIPFLQESYECYRLTFKGHGREGADKPIRMQYLVDQVVDYLDEQNISKANIFGYSMGGYAALALAKKHPQRINKIATLGTILQWNEEIAEKECRLLNPEKMEEKIPAFVQHLDEQHPNGWKKLVNNTREMLQQLGQHPLIQEDDWQHITVPIRLLMGDGDSTADLKWTAEIYKQLPNAQLGVLPNTTHPFNTVNKELLAMLLADHFDN